MKHIYHALFKSSVLHTNMVILFNLLTLGSITSCIIRIVGGMMTVDEVETTTLLSWPAFRHKQEIALRKEVIFLTAVLCDEGSSVWETQFQYLQIYSMYLMSVFGYYTNPEKKAI